MMNEVYLKRAKEMFPDASKDALQKVADVMALDAAREQNKKMTVNKPSDEKHFRVTITVESDSEEFLNTPIIIQRLSGRKEIIL